MSPRLLKRGSREHYLDGELYDYEYRRRRDDVRFYRRLAKQHGSPVLEIGCGTGRVACALARDAHRVVGFDLQPQMLRRCGERASRLPIATRHNVSLFVADMRTFTFGAKFPLIVAAFNTLQHIYDSDAMLEVLQSVRAHLSAGGRFAFDVQLPDLDWLSSSPTRTWGGRRFTHPTSGARYRYTMSVDYDHLTQVAHTRIQYDPADEHKKVRPKTVHLTQRQYFPQELRMLLDLAGFRVDQAAGDFEGGKMTAESESQVYVCIAK